MLNLIIKLSTLFKLCFATATHNLMWVKITYIFTILIESYLPLKMLMVIPPSNVLVTVVLFYKQYDIFFEFFSWIDEIFNSMIFLWYMLYGNTIRST